MLVPDGAPAMSSWGRTVQRVHSTGAAHSESCGASNQKPKLATGAASLASPRPRPSAESPEPRAAMRGGRSVTSTPTSFWVPCMPSWWAFVPFTRWAWACMPVLGSLGPTPVRHAALGLDPQCPSRRAPQSQPRRRCSCGLLGVGGGSDRRRGAHHERQHHTGALTLSRSLRVPATSRMAPMTARALSLWPGPSQQGTPPGWDSASRCGPTKDRTVPGRPFFQAASCHPLGFLRDRRHFTEQEKVLFMER